MAQEKLAEARDAWQAALALLPSGSQQHSAITEKLTAITAQLADRAEAQPVLAMPQDGPWWKRWGGGIAALGLLLLTKGKFLLLGLTKLKTFGSMFAFFGVYWAAFGWPLALGLVLSIYVHEMGHVYAIARRGGKPSAPMFIPGVGAFVSYSKGISDPREDAYIGLAGPIWGAGAGLVAYLGARYTGSAAWLAAAQLTGLLNLLNLIPVLGMDGEHGIKALDRLQRWVVIGAAAVVFWLTGVKMLLAVGAVAAWRALQPEQGPGDAGALANFIGLFAVLAWLAALKPI